MSERPDLSEAWADFVAAVREASRVDQFVAWLARKFPPPRR